MNMMTVMDDFHSVEFAYWTGDPLFTCENVASNLNRMLRVKFQCVRFSPAGKFH